MRIKDVDNKYGQGQLVVRFLQERLADSIKVFDIGDSHMNIYKFVKMIRAVEIVSNRAI